MQIKIKPRSFFIFDLDDTLYPEIEFLRSAFKEIASELAPAAGTGIYEEMCRLYSRGENVFKELTARYRQLDPGISIAGLLKIYREHLPAIKLRRDAARLLQRISALSVPAGLITDGRSITQRNKLKALHLENYFSDIIISEEFGSEKPDERNYRYYTNKYPGHEFYFVGDNTSKDFIVPARLGWLTICVKDNGSHIHTQAFSNKPYPDAVITSFDEIHLI